MEIEMTNQMIAKIIIEQMGGFGKLGAMINGRNYIAIENGVQFDFSGVRKANKCVVTLNAMDTYEFELWKITKKIFKKIYALSDVYCDMLISVFEDETGLYLSL